MMKQRGVAAIELAIVIPLLLLLVFGVTEFGRAMYQYNTIAKSARDSARYLSTQAPGTNQVEAKARIESSVEPLLGDNTFTIEICDAADSSACPNTQHKGVSTGTGTVNLVTVTVTGYEFQSALFTFIPALENITFAPISVTMRQAL